MGCVVSVTPRPSFTSEKGPSLPIGQDVGRASELVWTMRLEDKYFASAGDRSPVVQSVVRYYTD
jgi:hypothetical protein